MISRLTKTSPHRWVAACVLVAALGAPVLPLIMYDSTVAAGLAAAGTLAVATLISSLLAGGRLGSVRRASMLTLVVSSAVALSVPAVGVVHYFRLVVADMGVPVDGGSPFADVSNLDALLLFASVSACMVAWFASATVLASFLVSGASLTGAVKASWGRVVGDPWDTIGRFTGAAVLWGAIFTGLGMTLWLPVQVLALYPFTALVGSILLSVSVPLLVSWAALSISITPFLSHLSPMAVVSNE